MYEGRSVNSIIGDSVGFDDGTKDSLGFGYFDSFAIGMTDGITDDD